MTPFLLKNILLSIYTFTPPENPIIPKKRGMRMAKRIVRPIPTSTGRKIAKTALPVEI